ncbi:YitT family protein [Gilvibacter sediminis]|uniref:YitT family protein n=1 Tax=Gilvibacter sediminis TaxID=379071 RepID=UPI00234FF4BF|nr:YitT family protein [Gilvibacter sediminis]MDC7997934.1 YitT family protein [Gilvibacter sediminis]
MSLNRSLIFELLQIALAVCLASIGLKAFLLPNGFLDGGVTGIAILIAELFHVELSYTLPIITIPFFVIGWFTVARKILIKSIFSVLVLAVMIHFENFQSITDDKLIISIFGGLFLGAGIGLAIKNGSVLDGSEIFGIYINEKWGLSIGRVILVFNIVLFGITAFLLSVEVALYSILTYIVTAKAIDYTIEGFEDHVGLMIVTEHPADLRQAFTEKLGIGMTVYKGTKGVGSRGEKDDVEIIHSVINRIDIRRVQRLIDHVDPDAFVIEFDVNNVRGGILRKYLSRDRSKK